MGRSTLTDQDNNMLLTVNYRKPLQVFTLTCIRMHAHTHEVDTTHSTADAFTNLQVAVNMPRLINMDVINALKTQIAHFL